MSPAVAVSAADITPTPEFERAAALLDNGRNILLTGKAGTGKSTFLDWFREGYSGNMAVVAPTGVAALNVRGQTIHSLFELRPGFQSLEKRKYLRNRKLIKELDLLVIDEISMVRADVFDAIAATLRQYGPKPRFPFGGVQICLIGDLFQLPPIVNNEEREIFQQVYPGPHFFAAQAWDATQFTAVNFESVFRQKEAAFLDLLNRIRAGQRSPELLDVLNQRVAAAAPDHPGLVTLTTTNSRAGAINDSRLQALDTRSRTYQGQASGSFALQGQNLPAPQDLLLKIGAQVMFTRNDTPGRRWVNGTVGTVRALEKEQIVVEVEKNGQPRLYEVEPETWKSVRYRVEEGSDKIHEEETGSYTQFPLTLAWAVTIHKSQGKTLERVIVDLDRGAFAPGQLYVALSRCRSLEHLFLTRPVVLSDIRVDPRIVAFLEGLEVR